MSSIRNQWRRSRAVTTRRCKMKQISKDFFFLEAFLVCRQICQSGCNRSFLQQLEQGGYLRSCWWGHRSIEIKWSLCASEEFHWNPHKRSWHHLSLTRAQSWFKKAINTDTKRVTHKLCYLMCDIIAKCQMFVRWISVFRFYLSVQLGQCDNMFI